LLSLSADWFYAGSGRGYRQQIGDADIDRTLVCLPVHPLILEPDLAQDAGEGRVALDEGIGAIGDADALTRRTLVHDDRRTRIHARCIRDRLGRADIRKVAKQPLHAVTAAGKHQ
jgi:hypothetical protein